jgi:hypothetical protein
MYRVPIKSLYNLITKQLMQYLPSDLLYVLSAYQSFYHMAFVYFTQTQFENLGIITPPCD